MKKKSTIVAASLLTAILVFGAGFYSGLNYWGIIFPDVTNLTFAYTEIIPLQMNIEQMDRGDQDGVRENLQLELDGAISKTYQLLKESDNSEQNTKASNWLKRAANYRKKHPPTYPSSVQDSEFQQSKSYVASILAEFEGKSNQMLKRTE